MKNNKIKNIKFSHILTLVCLLCSSASLSSCNKWLDIKPEDSVPAEDLFARGDGFRNALNGLYLNLANDELYGKELTWGFVSAISQQYHIQSSAAPYYDAALLEYQTASPKKTINNIWEKGYQVIANSNKLLAAIELAAPGIFIYGADERDLIQGEALAIRAMVHLDLFRLFAPAVRTAAAEKAIPYRKTYSPLSEAPISGSDFMAEVIADLLKARELVRKNDLETHIDGMMATGAAMPTPFMNARVRFGNLNRIGEEGIFFSNRGSRMNYLAITGLLSRAYLYMNDYSNASQYAKELYDVFYKEKAWVGFTPSNNINPSYNPDGNYGVKKYFDDILLGLYKKNLIESYQFTEVQRPLAYLDDLFRKDTQAPYTDWRYSFSVQKTNDVNPLYYTTKYNDMSAANKSSMPDESKLLPIIRLSEIFHCLAEAAHQQGDNAKAIDYLTQLRIARGALRSIRVAELSHAEVLEEILSDYKKEFIAEGELFYLYKRLQILEVKSATAGRSINLATKFVLPIPESELVN